MPILMHPSNAQQGHVLYNRGTVATAKESQIRATLFTKIKDKLKDTPIR